MADSYPSNFADGDPLLLLRPQPGRQEGPQGYLLRLAEANCMSLGELVHVGTRYEHAWLGRHHLLPDAMLDPDLHLHVTRMTNMLQRNGRIWNRCYARFCPLCLSEDPTWRASWELYFHDVCPHHGIWLVDQCSSCRQPLRWNRDAVLRCECGSDLRQEVTHDAPARLQTLSGLLETKLLGGSDNAETPLSSLDVEQTQRLIRYMGGYMDPQANPKPLKLRNSGRMEVSWAISSRAAELLGDWPYRFHETLSLLQDSSTGQKTGLKGLFHQAYAYLYKGLKESAFLPVRDAFEIWLAEHWKGGLARRNRRLTAELLRNVRWISGSIAADTLGISVARLRYLISEGRLEGQESISTKRRKFLLVRHDQLEQICAELSGEMTMSDAMSLLGIGKVRMQRILRLLFPTARRIYEKVNLPWSVPRGEVEALLALGKDLPVVSIPDEHQVSLGHVFQFWTWTGEEIVTLVEAVKDGTLLPKAMLSSDRGIRRWVFDVPQLRSLQQRLRTGHSNWVTVPEMARILEVKQQVAYWLTHYGFVHIERLENDKERIGSRVHRDEVERFRQTYIFGRDIAAILGRSSRKVASMLAEQDIFPLRADGAEACRQLVYARSDEIQRFLAQITGSSPGAFKLIRSPGPPGQSRIIEADGNGPSEFPIHDLQPFDPVKFAQ